MRTTTQSFELAWEQHSRTGPMAAVLLNPTLCWVRNKSRGLSKNIAANLFLAHMRASLSQMRVCYRALQARAGLSATQIAVAGGSMQLFVMRDELHSVVNWKEYEFWGIPYAVWSSIQVQRAMAEMIDLPLGEVMIQVDNLVDRQSSLVVEPGREGGFFGIKVFGCDCPDSLDRMLGRAEALADNPTATEEAIDNLLGDTIFSEVVRAAKER